MDHSCSVPLLRAFVSKGVDCIGKSAEEVCVCIQQMQTALQGEEAARLQYDDIGRTRVGLEQDMSLMLERFTALLDIVHSPDQHGLPGTPNGVGVLE